MMTKQTVAATFVAAGIAVTAAGVAMGQGMQGGMDSGMMQGGMGPGMMQGGMGSRMGQGTMGRGMMMCPMMQRGSAHGMNALLGSRVAPMLNLSVEDVRGYLSVCPRTY